MTADPKLTNPDLAPVDATRRTWSWYHIASLWIGMAICIPTYTLASSLVGVPTGFTRIVGHLALGPVEERKPRLDHVPRGEGEDQVNGAPSCAGLRASSIDPVRHRRRGWWSECATSC